jgi:hypothetical protein
VEDAVDIYEWGTLAVAVIALVQPWGVWIYRKYLRPGKLELYKTGSLEIGFSLFGPTIAFIGTLRALNHDAFVEEVTAKVIRVKDKAEHDFRWIAFRPASIDITGRAPIEMEFASSFLVTPNSPRRLNILFNDERQLQDMTPTIQKYIAEWHKCAYGDTTSGANKVFDPSSDQKSECVNKFKQETISAETYGSLLSKFYWEPGNYSLSIEAVVAKPNGPMIRRYDFQVTEGDSEGLKLNIISMLQTPLSAYLEAAPPNWQISYSPLKDAK